MQSLHLCAESIGGIQRRASQSRHVASVAAAVAGAVVACAAAAAAPVSSMDMLPLHLDLYGLCMDLSGLYRLRMACMDSYGLV